jgi:hypothetical protein
MIPLRRADQRDEIRYFIWAERRMTPSADPPYD